MRQFLEFASAPFLWSAAVLALYAPFPFIAPVIQPPPANCTDWLWCDSSYVGLVFDPMPDPSSLAALLIIPGAMLSFFAARYAVGGPNRYAHWFMAPFVIALAGLSLAFLFFPFALFINVTDSYRPALIVQSQHLAIMVAIMASVPIGLLELAGAAFLRAFRRPPDTHSVPSAAR